MNKEPWPYESGERPHWASPANDDEAMHVERTAAPSPSILIRVLLCALALVGLLAIAAGLPELFSSPTP